MGGEAPARRAAGRYRTGSWAPCLRQVRGEASGVVEVGLVARGMGQRPVGFRTVLFFKDRGKAEFPRAFRVHADGRAEGPPGEIVLHTNVWRRDLRICPALAIGREVVGRPFAGGREVPFAVG